MNKTLKKLTIMLVLVLAILGLSKKSYATITESTNTGNIKVSGVEAGVSVSIYPITTVDYDYTADMPKAVPYIWNANVKTWIDTNYPNYSDPENFYKLVTSNSAEAKEFYSKLSAVIKDGTVLVTPVTQTVTGTTVYPVPDTLSGETTFASKEMGTYLILIENGYMVYTSSVVNLTPEFNTTSKEWELVDTVTANIKSTKPQITKTVTDTIKTADNYGTNDVIPFTIVADKPNYEKGSSSTTYKITDTLSNGLSLDVNSVKVYGVQGNSSAELTETTNYTITKSAKKLEVTFVYNSLTNFDTVKITYNANLDKLSTTVIGNNGNVNTAVLTYSNNPYTISEQTQKSSNTVYVYGAEITKTDKATGNAISGAKFTLSSGDTVLYFVKNENGEYYQAKETDTNKTTDLEVNEDGKLYIYGLDEGTYSLKEIKAPDGYNIDSTSKIITIKDDDLNGILDDETGITGMFKLTVPNSSGFILPVTGGAGTVVFVATGMVCIGLGILILIVVIKKKYSNK